MWAGFGERRCLQDHNITSNNASNTAHIKNNNPTNHASTVQSNKESNGQETVRAHMQNTLLTWAELYRVNTTLCKKVAHYFVHFMLLCLTNTFAGSKFYRKIYFILATAYVPKLRIFIRPSTHSTAGRN